MTLDEIARKGVNINLTFQGKYMYGDEKGKWSCNICGRAEDTGDELDITRQGPTSQDAIDEALLAWEHYARKVPHIAAGKQIEARPTETVYETPPDIYRNNSLEV